MISPVQFGARVQGVTYFPKSDSVAVEVIPESEAELDKYARRFPGLLSSNHPTTLHGGRDNDFGRSYLGSSFAPPENVTDAVLAAELISKLKFTKKSLTGTELTEAQVKHRLLKGLARILCADAIAFRDQFTRMTRTGKNDVTL